MLWDTALYRADLPRSPPSAQVRGDEPPGIVGHPVGRIETLYQGLEGLCSPGETVNEEGCVGRFRDSPLDGTQVYILGLRYILRSFYRLRYSGILILYGPSIPSGGTSHL